MDESREFLRHRPRVRSQIVYSLIKSNLRFLPFRTYAVAHWLMSRRQLKLRSGVVRVNDGLWVIVPDCMSTWAFPFGLKEPHVQHFLNVLLAEADAFVDCGANLGWYSFLASRRRNIKWIVAVEPLWQSVRYLEFIKKLNGINHLNVVRGCVSDHNGQVFFYRERGRFAEMGYVTDAPNPDGQRLVQSYTLESILHMLDASLRRISIKIDVEGHEGPVLASLSAETLRKRVDSVIVEAHLYKFREPADELERICRLLSPLGSVGFVVLAPQIHSGYQRLWWRWTKRYPLVHMSVQEMKELVAQHALPEVYVLARRGS